MWIRAEGKAGFATAEAPGWVSDWLSRRRGPSSSAQSSTPRASAADIDAEEPEADPKVAARERSRRERESSVLGGIEELDSWLSDQVDAGLTAFAAAPSAPCRTMAQRLVDAKAGGLAARVDSIPARLFQLAESQRAIAAVSELGVLHLLSSACRRQNDLPPVLREDVRQAAGWTMTRDAVLSDAHAIRRSGTWTVFMSRSHVQADKLRRNETWLLNGSDHAVLVDYVPVSTGASSGGYFAGERIEAELAYYPSAVPQRALIAESRPSEIQPAEALQLPGTTLAESYEAYEAALAGKPWIDDFPLFFRSATLLKSGATLYLASDGIALPVSPDQSDAAWPLLACGAIDGVGLWNGVHFYLAWIETPIGRWKA